MILKNNYNYGRISLPKFRTDSNHNDQDNLALVKEQKIHQ